MDEIFKKEYIFLNEDFNRRDEAFKFIANQAVKLDFVENSQDILEALYEREDQASTGMQDGIAIPHAILTMLKEPAVLFVRSSSEIQDWPTFDEKPVNQIIAMLVPKNSEQEHLQVLADFAGALIDDDERQALLNSKTVTEIYNVLTNNLDEKI